MNTIKNVPNGNYWEKTAHYKQQRCEKMYRLGFEFCVSITHSTRVIIHFQTKKEVQNVR
jgi:hypothetical protein